MIKRSITGIVLVLVLVALAFVQGWPLRIAMTAFMALSIWEVYGAFKHKGANPARWVGMTYAALLLPVYIRWGAEALWPLMTACCMVGFAVMIFRGVTDFAESIATVFPILYPGMMFTMIIPLQDLGEPAIATLALITTFAMAFLCDTSAFAVGVLWGKHKLCPAISPKKTVEGAVAGLVGASLAGVLVVWVVGAATTYIPYFQPYQTALPPMWHFALLGLFGGVAAQLGDLTASMVKRYCGIKDFGSILPGHGGMMDRIDSVLFSAVMVYIYFMVMR